ncbi:DUF4363 family protein [Desulfurispora thermophila]|uniref:DUF4363 family protein n=1 Tax=Desulfurispora thermophila TaxID=265470 RepID=UPI0003634BAD|nr:DUF4363 family protein [Desulfurispora thermophila]
MRLLISLLILLGLIVYGGLYVHNQLASQTSSMVSQVEEIKSAARKKDWTRAEQQLAGVTNIWRKQQGWWTLLMNHQEIEAVDFALARTQAAVETQNSAACAVEAEELKAILQHIPEKEAFALRNIL